MYSIPEFKYYHFKQNTLITNYHTPPAVIPSQCI